MANHKTVSVDPSVYEELKKVADSEHRSMAAQIAYWVEQYQDQRKAVANG